ncbi:MAG TPA: GyrI-like domain-containing protein [Candidatus Acidoferrales bacterium]|jgi:predicted transcriptional regulator YdeE|nr:GyrI-like domain-containing protein [Candidatus Acidoferrales bacterium]
MSAHWAAIGILAIGLAMPSAGDVPLTPKIVEQAGFSVIGISARTTNANEMSGKGVIGQAWGRFMSEGLLSKIPNKVDANVLAVYTDYESDANGAYTFILGAKVSSADNVPPGLVAKKIPAARYAVFTSEKGPVAKVVPQTWSHIWALPRSAPGGSRAYRADFELYDRRAADPQNSQVDVYVGIE